MRTLRHSQGLTMRRPGKGLPTDVSQPNLNGSKALLPKASAVRADLNDLRADRDQPPRRNRTSNAFWRRETSRPSLLLTASSERVKLLETVPEDHADRSFNVP
jgi:hypothetical protein